MAYNQTMGGKSAYGDSILKNTIVSQQQITKNVFEDLDEDSYDEDMYKNWQKRINMNKVKKQINEEDEAGENNKLDAHDVFREYKDKSLSADDMNVDISTVDIFSYARHGRINQLK